MTFPGLYDPCVFQYNTCKWILQKLHFFVFLQEITLSVFTMLATKTTDIQSNLPKQKLFSTDVKGLVLLQDLFQEICKVNCRTCFVKYSS